MEIVPIFTPYLHSFKFDNGIDELSRLFEMWTDTEQLYDYFRMNSDVLKYEKIDIDEAVTQTIENSDLLYDLLSENRANLDDLFQPLSNNSAQIKLLPKCKSKKRWLRLYAINIDSSYYVVTGGAIKQSQEMRDHLLTREELKKLEQCRNFLIDNDIFDSDSLMDFVEF
ncbi:MAG: hypothetical protein Q8S54_14200 [Bacteroidota bacterium]|nr:hypothetical protein [Bacteroidota bacterium]